jgi:hypothetical protein
VITKERAILAINPEAEFHIVGGDLDTCEITWLEGTDEISKADIQAKYDELKIEDDVIQARIKLYGSTAEQLEYIVENGVDAFIAKQNQIKSDNPKG